MIGLDALLSNDAARLRGKSIALLCNQASVTSDYRHILDVLLPYHQRGDFRIQVVFGPEHGLFGHTQDNMIEWEGAPDPRTGLTVHSLYGQHRKPTAAMMAEVDLFVSDIPDVGSRYYTFVWTMAHCLETCAELGIPALVLDRPNPIGRTIEGTVLEPEFISFVGLYPVPTRHGLTASEIARYLQLRYLPTLNLEVERVQNWTPGLLDSPPFPWAMPSPNMPTVATALVYPGGCLLEATNLSEGRGTTRPFEIFGAPWIDGWRLADDLNSQDLAGVYFRPLPFEPTFNKHARTLCEGCFVHVTDPTKFEPVLTYVAILQAVIRQGGIADPAGLPVDETFTAASAETTLGQFAWRLGPYEYVTNRRPIDILAGNRWLEPAISNLEPLTEIRDHFRAEVAEFAEWHQAAELYSGTRPQ